jgi:hypothetical protein
MNKRQAACYSSFITAALRHFFILSILLIFPGILAG